MVPVRVHNHDLSSASKSAGSRSFRTRRIVDCDGRAWPASTPKDRRSAPVRSVVCSHIAVRLRQPASTPVMARDGTVGRPQAHAPTVPGINHVPENLDQGLARQGGRGGG